jgi:hypothetical protein
VVVHRCVSSICMNDLYKLLLHYYYVQNVRKGEKHPLRAFPWIEVGLSIVTSMALSRALGKQIVAKTSHWC